MDRNVNGLHPRRVCRWFEAEEVALPAASDRSAVPHPRDTQGVEAAGHRTTLPSTYNGGAFRGAESVWLREAQRLDPVADGQCRQGGKSHELCSPR